jgi:hypothetical protein
VLSPLIKLKKPPSISSSAKKSLFPAKVSSGTSAAGGEEGRHAEPSIGKSLDGELKQVLAKGEAVHVNTTGTDDDLGVGGSSEEKRRDSRHRYKKI